MNDCGGNCTYGCTRTCTTVCEGCGSDCRASNADCTGACSYSCTGTGVSPGNFCNQCGKGCGGHCAGLCVSCGNGCTGGCTNSCNTCTGTCSSNCGTYCGGCDGTCTGCSGTCMGGCTGCSGTCTGSCGANCQNACGNCSHGCAVVANKEAYDYIKLGIKKLITGKDARMLRDLFMEEIYRRLKNPFHKFTTTTNVQNIEIKSADGQEFSSYFIKEIIYVVVNGKQLTTKEYSFNQVTNIIYIPSITTESKVAISYVTTEENDSMLILYETGKMLVDNNLLSSVKVSDNVNSTINPKHLAKQVVPEEYRKVAVALYDQMIANDPNENGSSWADE